MHLNIKFLAFDKMTSFTISLILFLVVALFASIVTVIFFTRNFDDDQPNTGCFRAAVLDHFPIRSTNVDDNIQLTFPTFVKATELAKKNVIWKIFLFSKIYLLLFIHYSLLIQFNSVLFLHFRMPI